MAGNTMEKMVALLTAARLITSIPRIPVSLNPTTSISSRAVTFSAPTVLLQRHPLNSFLNLSISVTALPPKAGDTLIGPLLHFRLLLVSQDELTSSQCAGFGVPYNGFLERPVCCFGLCGAQHSC